MTSAPNPPGIPTVREPLTGFDANAAFELAGPPGMNQGPWKPKCDCKDDRPKNEPAPHSPPPPAPPAPFNNSMPGVPTISDRIQLELDNFNACISKAGLIFGLKRALPDQETGPEATYGAAKDAYVYCLGRFPLAALGPSYPGLPPGDVFPSDVFGPFF